MEMDELVQLIPGFLDEPQTTARGSLYTGRLTIPGVKWTLGHGRALATATLTLREIVDAAENRMLWTDQDVQRGIKPTAKPRPPRELALADGYPSADYVFDEGKADEIAQKLLGGEQVFLDPMTWNLRPDGFEAYWDPESSNIHLYEGKIYLPDSHHRHQGLLKAARTFKEAVKGEYPEFDLETELAIEINFLSKEDEGNFFYDKNLLPKPTEKSKSFDLTTRDTLAVLAKTVIEKSPSLIGNVNRVTDRLTVKNPQVMTLSTLRAMIDVGGGSEVLASEVTEIAERIARFYELLVEARPELGTLSEVERRDVRKGSLVDSAVMMHGYGVLLGRFLKDADTVGMDKAEGLWRDKLELLKEGNDFQYDKWAGDFFDRENPMWRQIGVLQETKSGRETISNTRQTRALTGEKLRDLLGLEP